jgi:hypothetical protein
MMHSEHVLHTRCSDTDTTIGFYYPLNVIDLLAEKSYHRVEEV